MMHVQMRLPKVRIWVWLAVGLGIFVLLIGLSLLSGSSVRINLDNSTFFALFALVFGTLIHMGGWRRFFQKRLIENLPTSHIRGLAMGFVEIQGKVKAALRHFLTSPLSGRHCVYYKYAVEEYKSQGKRSSWVTIDSGREGTPFYVEDSTGTVLIDPKDAEVDIPQDYRFETGTGLFKRTELPATLDAFLTSKHLTVKALLGEKQMRFTEHYLAPDDTAFILGTAGDNPYREEATARASAEDVMIQCPPGALCYISDKGEREVLKAMTAQALGGIIGGGALGIGGLAWLLFQFGLL